MNYLRKTFSLISTLFLFNSCTKDIYEVLVNIYLNHSDYNSFLATNVSVTSITIDGEVVPYDFDNWSNISEGTTKKITVSAKVENSSFEVELIVRGVGSEIVREYSINNVSDGDDLDLDLGTGDFTIRDGSGEPSSSCSQYFMPGGDCLDIQGNPGIKIKLCKQSETSTQVTVKAHFEPNNKGIDEDWYAQIKMYAGDSQSKTMNPNEFNSKGWISNAFTMDKTIITSTQEKAVWNDEQNVHIGVQTGIKYYGSVGFAACFR